MRKKYLLRLCLVFLTIILFANGFAERKSLFKTVSQPPQTHDEQQAPFPETESESAPESDPAIEHAPAQQVMAASAMTIKGGGLVTYGTGAQRLDIGKENLLTDYMNAYYTSLALFEVQDASPLFSPDAQDQVRNYRAALNMLIGIRNMQRTDLTLSGYSFELAVQAVTEEGNGDMRVRVLEKSVQNFTAYPGVDSASFNITHTFLLTNAGEGWRIKEHRQAGSLNRLIMGMRGWQAGTSQSSHSVNANVESNVENLLANARAAVERRKTQGDAGEEIRIDHAYDRTAAASYAREWADNHNSNWPNYDRLGGNCQNFASQAIFAGGIPMDYASPGQWKWYGDAPSGSFQPSGRSPSWSGVSEFLDYVQSNGGFGMVAQADAPYYSGEVGDVIHMSVDGDWRHTVVITEVIKDKNGNTVDYLIASNTADLRDFPVSAFYYADQTLIKIYGWNE